MRTRGSIEHEWFRKYIDNDGARYFVWGGRPRSQGMPAFPSGRAAPGYPRVGGAKPTKRHRSRPGVLTAELVRPLGRRVLHLPPRAPALARSLLLERLADLDVLHVDHHRVGRTVLQHPAELGLVAGPIGRDLGRADHLLVCDTCQAPRLPGTRPSSTSSTAPPAWSLAAPDARAGRR